MVVGWATPLTSSALEPAAKRLLKGDTVGAHVVADDEAGSGVLTRVFLAEIVAGARAVAVVWVADW